MSPSLVHESPSPLADPLSKRIESDFDNRVRVLRKSMRRIRKQTDSEAIHDTRVASRRLQAALRMWRPYLPRRRGRLAGRSLRELRRSLGRARDLEVHCELLAGLMRSPENAGNDALKQLARRLSRRMERARRAAAGRLRRKCRRRVLRGVERGCYPLCLDRGESPILNALEQVNSRRDDALALLDPGLGSGDEEARLHRARIEVKKWRYGLECLRVVVPDRFLTPTDPLRELQERLGEIHDLTTLRSLLIRHRDRLSRKDLLLRASALGALAEGVEQERQEKIRVLRIRFVNLRSSLRAAKVPPSPWAPLPLRDEPGSRGAFPEGRSAAGWPRFPAALPAGQKPES